MIFIGFSKERLGYRICGGTDLTSRHLDWTRLVVLNLFSCSTTADTLTVIKDQKFLNTISHLLIRDIVSFQTPGGPFGSPSLQTWGPSMEEGAAERGLSARPSPLRGNEDAERILESASVSSSPSVGRTKTSGAFQAVPVWNVHKLSILLTTDFGDNYLWIGPRRPAPCKRCLSGMSKQFSSTSTNIRSRL